MTAVLLYLFTAILLAVCYLDWRQTLTIARSPDRWTEANPILGKHPTTKRVNIYFAVVFAIIVLAALLLPTLLCVGIFSACIPIESWVVWRNKRHGITL